MNEGGIVEEIKERWTAKENKGRIEKMREKQGTVQRSRRKSREKSGNLKENY